MRPRHKAAENADSLSQFFLAVAVASMRPRHKAAENAAFANGQNRNGPGFNEAAA